MVTGTQPWSLRQDPLFFKQAQKSSQPSVSVYAGKLVSFPLKPVVIVPKHVAKQAVTRHRLKRQIRSIIRLSPNVDWQIVVVIHRFNHNLTYAQLQAQISQALAFFKNSHV